MIKNLLTIGFLGISFLANCQYIIRDNFKDFLLDSLHRQQNWSNQYNPSAAGVPSYSGAGTGDALTSGTNNGARGRIIAGNMNIPNFIQTDKVLSIRSNGDGIGKLFPTGEVVSGSVYVAIPFRFSAFVQASNGATITTEMQFVRGVFQDPVGSSPQTTFRVTVKPVIGGYNLGCYKSGLNTSIYKSTPTLFTLNQDVLIVLKYTFNPGLADDELKLFINPNLTLPESSSTPEVTTTAYDDVLKLDGINFNFNNIARPTAEIGGLMVSTTWPSVQNALPLSCIENLQLNKTNTTNATLSWDAVNCRAARHFTIQQSTNGKDFNDVETIKNIGDNGKYSGNFKLLDGVNFVRLAITDIHGQTIYSSTLSIRKGNLSIQQMNLYPNPTKNILNVSLKTTSPDEFYFQILNAQGQIVSNQKRTINFIGESSIGFDLSLLTAGNYILKYTNKSGVTASKSFIKN
jgi:hypothetical protein